MPFRYYKNINRYRAPNGRFISPRKVRSEIDKTIETAASRMKQSAQKFNEGKINLPQFQIEMAELVKSSHIVAGTTAAGGKEQMQSKDWGEIGRALKEQYKFLNNFARQISREQVSPAQIENRAKSYAQSARLVYETKQRAQAVGSDMVKARRILHAAEHCEPCVSWARKGFVDVESLPPIGSLTCGYRCRCHVEYQ